MAAASVWSTSGHANRPESPYDAFLRNPRDRDGEIRLRDRQPRHDEDAVVFRAVMEGK